MTERYRTNREFLFPESGPALPEPGVEVVILEGDDKGNAVLCETVDARPDPGNGEGEVEYNRTVFWAFRTDLYSVTW